MSAKITKKKSKKAETINLISDITLLPGIGEAVAEKLKKAKITKVADFLFTLPIKYQDKTKITNIIDMDYGESFLIVVEVISSRIIYSKHRMLVVQAKDKTSLITLRFFNFSKAQQKILASGVKLQVYGQAVTSKDQWAMMHPEYEIINNGIKLENCLTPVYSIIQGIGSKRIANWVSIAISCLEKEEILDFSDKFLNKNNLSKLSSALKNINQPQVGVLISDILNSKNPDLARIVLDELLAKQIAMLRKKELAAQIPGNSMAIDDSIQAVFLSKLDFTLTKAQLRVVGDIFTDLQLKKPMHRLIQGDVGSGKTVVAFSACLQAINNSYQTVFMAPTEILAEQHFAQAKELLLDMEIDIVWLSGKTKIKDRRESLKKIENGQAQLIIGTHALFQKDVIYNNLGLVIIDEQHRFGVEQRLRLREKAEKTGKMPDLLVMTATPIPRTLAMSFYADLDTSIIDELPPNRKSIETVLLAESKRDELIARVNIICEKGQQVYWVCALIEESEMLEAKAAEDLYESLKQQLPNLNIALLHGRQKSEEKEDTINKFQQNLTQVLVATTVIEVGVNVPNASLMVIENAERFGLAQLHQLRGRVGRGINKSYCILLYKSPLSQVAKQRLQVIRNSSDGFLIAKEDLKIRGAGEVLGTKQTGEVLFKIADIERDAELLEKAFYLAEKLILEQPRMADEIVSRWIGDDENYINV